LIASQYSSAMRPRLLPVVSLLVLILSGCSTLPSGAPVAGTAVPATLVGSEEKSAMLDNFTAFISAVDGRDVAAGRTGWNTPVELKAGRHVLAVEFRRGVFSARAQLEVVVAAKAAYQLKFNTDAQLFGKNSFCDFWIVDLATNQPVTATIKAAVVKGG
jgi:hypothetical protein